jgi:hypothetical protein
MIVSAANVRRWPDSAVAGIQVEWQLPEDELPYTAIEHLLESDAI